jgi:hypothetical protein
MHCRPLDETDLYVLFQEQEDVFLVEKGTNAELWRTWMYGNPTCGVIGRSNEWVIVGGEKLIVWRNAELKVINDTDLNWIHRIRQTGETQIQMLTDPWEENASIWSYDIYMEEKIKIRDFPDYRLKEYTEDIEW